MEINTLTSTYGDIAYDMDDQSIKTYVRFQALHQNAFKYEIDNIQSVVTMDNIPNDEYRKFFLKLLRYEKQHEYNYTKTYKAICGIKIELLLPRRITSNTQKIKLVKSYMTRLNPIGYKIPWIAYTVKRGSATYMIVLMSEREYIDRNQPKIYNRNYYDRNGNLTHKKGDPMLKHGKPLMEHTLWSNKVRLFTYSRASFQKLVTDLIDKYVSIVKTLLNHIETRFRLKQKNVREKWHFFNRKVCLEINDMKKYIEFHCNYALSLQKDSSTTPWLEEHRARSAPVAHMKELTTIFHKYKARFEKECFHDHQGVMRKIAYHKVPLDQLQENLSILKKEFKQELGLLIPKAFQ